MKITVWGINYRPEVTGIAPCNTALCEALRERGHEVRMVTTFSYYPAWRKQTEDAGRLFRTDLENGIPVHRCWHYVPRRATALKRIFHELSFVTLSWLRILSLPRADATIVVSPPLLLGAAAWLAAGCKRAPFVFHIQDLQPDAAVGLGMLRPGPLTRALYALEHLAYRKARLVSGISRAMLRKVRAKGIAEEKLVYFPNGADLGRTPPAPGKFRAAFGFSPDDFLAIYSGNLGIKQGLKTVLDAASLLQNPRAKIVIVGEGAFRPAIEGYLRSHPEAPLRLLPLQPEETYEEMLVDADLCLITQQAGSGDYFLPSKLLRILALGRPVLACADAAGPMAEALAEGGFGFRAAAGDAAALAGTLDRLAADPAALAGMGARGRGYVEQFASDRVHAEFIDRLEREFAPTKRAGQ